MMKNIYLKDEYIKLGQALKLAGLVYSGAEAKELINEGYVKVNNEVVYQRGKKIYEGDILELEGEQVLVCR